MITAPTEERLDLFVVAWVLLAGGVFSLLTVIFAGAAVVLLPAGLVVGIVALARNLVLSAQAHPSHGESLPLRKPVRQALKKRL